MIWPIWLLGLKTLSWMWANFNVCWGIIRKKLHLALHIKHLSNFSTPICETHEEWVCAWNMINPSFFNYTENPYPKSCTIVQYSGEVELKYQNDEAYQAYFSYNFAPPRTVMVQEEYLIYDTIGFLGSIGGALGLCIGFSFSNTITFLLDKALIIKLNLVNNKK